MNDVAILAFANHCPNILAIYLCQCYFISNKLVTALIEKVEALRMLCLAKCKLIEDAAFLSLPNKTYECLIGLDLTSCAKLTDRAVRKIINVAPRLETVIFAKCKNLTDDAVSAISRLGRSLRVLDLSHCRKITDSGVKQLAAFCDRIYSLKLINCYLTDDSATRLATLPELMRVSLS